MKKFNFAIVNSVVKSVLDTVPKSVSERWRVKKGTGHC